MDVKGKVAFVTGASSGIGEATVRRLAAEGAAVVLASRRIDRLNAIVDELKASGGQALAIQTDVVDLDALNAAVEATNDQFGKIDILVANAGLMPLSDVETLKVDEWHRMVDVNVKGAFNTVAAVLPTMIAQKSGHIVNISSIAGRKTFTGLTVYCATKAAVAAFSDGLRMEIAPKHNIRVSCIQPGAVATELFEHITDEGYRKQMEALPGQMTMLESGDIADTILYALKAPAHVDVAELFVLPVQQGW